MVRRRASRSRKRRIPGPFAAEAAPYLCLAGASVSDQRGIRWLAAAFAPAGRQTVGGEKTSTQIGRAGKCGLATACRAPDRIRAGRTGSSGRFGGDAQGRNRAGNGPGAIRDSRRAACSSATPDVCGRSGNKRQGLGTADAANQTRRGVRKLAGERFLYTRGGRGGARASAGLL